MIGLVDKALRFCEAATNMEEV